MEKHVILVLKKGTLFIKSSNNKRKIKNMNITYSYKYEDTLVYMDMKGITK